MVEVAKALKEGRWVLLAFTVLLAIAAIAVPLATQQLVETTVRNVIAQEVTPMLEETQDLAREAQVSIQAVEDFNILDLRDRAIVAYNSKIFTVEDLQPLTQNGLAVRNGLQVPEIRQALFTLDPERTLMFERFFSGE